MEHNQPTPARPDIVCDPAPMAPVGPLVPGNFNNFNKSEEQLKAEEIAAQHARGKIACEKR
jgi:hypothetical protein